MTMGAAAPAAPQKAGSVLRECFLSLYCVSQFWQLPYKVGTILILGSQMRKQAQCGDGAWRQERFPETPENLLCVLGGRYGFPETPENLLWGPLAACSLRFFCFTSHNFWFFQLFF